MTIPCQNDRCRTRDLSITSSAHHPLAHRGHPTVCLAPSPHYTPASAYSLHRAPPARLSLIQPTHPLPPPLPPHPTTTITHPIQQAPHRSRNNKTAIPLPPHPPGHHFAPGQRVKSPPIFRPKSIGNSVTGITCPTHHRIPPSLPRYSPELFGFRRLAIFFAPPNFTPFYCTPHLFSPQNRARAPRFPAEHPRFRAAAFRPYRSNGASKPETVGSIALRDAFTTGNDSLMATSGCSVPVLSHILARTAIEFKKKRGPARGEEAQKVHLNSVRAGAPRRVSRSPQAPAPGRRTRAAPVPADLSPIQLLHPLLASDSLLIPFKHRPLPCSH